MRNEYSSSSSHHQYHHHHDHHHLLTSVEDVTRVRSSDSTVPAVTSSSAPAPLQAHTSESNSSSSNPKLMIPFSPIRSNFHHDNNHNETALQEAAEPPVVGMTTPSPYNHHGGRDGAATTTTTTSFTLTETPGRNFIGSMPALVTPSRPGLNSSGTASLLPQRRTLSSTTATGTSTSPLLSPPQPSRTTATTSTATTTTAAEGPWRTKELSGVFREESCYMVEQQQQHLYYPDLLSMGRSYAFDEDDAEF